MRYSVAITDTGFPGIDIERSVLEPSGAEISLGECRTPAETALLCKRADAILTNLAPIDADVIRQLENCKIIVRYGVGVDNIDVRAAAAKGIPVVNIPDYAVSEVADHTLALLLGIVRRIPQIDRDVRNGLWNIAPYRPMMGLSGKVLGLAGFGNIARAVAERAKPFGLRIAAYDPYLDDGAFERAGAVKVDWETLVTQSDILSLHLPLTERTKHLIDRTTLRRMKRESVIVNTSRGGLIDTAALAEALESRTISGAALDVLETEPAAPDHPLFAYGNCIVTSHCAWYSELSIVRLQQSAAWEVRKYFEGEMPRNIVNRRKEEGNA